MTKRMRDPYVVRTRRTSKPKPDKKDKSMDSYVAFGEDALKGVEVRIQTEHGSLSLKVFRDEYGNTQAKLRAFQHKDFTGRMVGLNDLLWHGTVDGQWHGQATMFGKEPKD